MAYKLLVFLGLLMFGFFAGAAYTNLNETNLNNKEIHSPANVPDQPIAHDNEENILKLESDIAALQQTQQASQQHQLTLEERINELTKQVTLLKSAIEEQTSQTESISSNEAPQISREQLQEIHNPFMLEPPISDEEKETRLISYGFTNNDIKEFKALEDQVELDRLYLRDQAMRENWINTPRYREELQQLSSENELRNTMTDERYDQYLYATDQYNRVSIEEVMIGSAAEASGLQSHDTILSYDDQRIFNWSDVREASTAGNAGEPVTITVMRDGKTLQFTIPRGPLGVRLDMSRVEP